MPTYEVPRVTGGTEEVETYSRLVGFGTMINYIIGTGVFSIPFAYYKAGWRLTTICVIIFAFLSDKTKNRSAFLILGCTISAIGWIIGREYAL